MKKENLQADALNIEKPRKTNPWPLLFMLFLCVAALAMKALWILGGDVPLAFVYLFSTLAIISCPWAAIRTGKNNKKLLAVPICALILLISLLFVRIPAARFHLFRQAYDTAAQNIYKQVLTQENGFYLELPEHGSWLGKVHYFKTDQGIAISFQERYTFFDCFCYIKNYSNTDIDSLIPDLQTIESLGNEWYYVNLF